MLVTIHSLERLNNSANGNPRFKVFTDKGTFITASDHAFVYMINNGWRGRESRQADIQLSRRNTITHLTYVN